MREQLASLQLELKGREYIVFSYIAKGGSLCQWPVV